MPAYESAQNLSEGSYISSQWLIVGFLVSKWKDYFYLQTISIDYGKLTYFWNIDHITSFEPVSNESLLFLSALPVTELATLRVNVLKRVALSVETALQGKLNFVVDVVVVFVVVVVGGAAVSFVSVYVGDIINFVFDIVDIVVVVVVVVSIDGVVCIVDVVLSVVKVRLWGDFMFQTLI
jgi:hypothetical protein